jgi:type II restriction enzyme
VKPTFTNTPNKIAYLSRHVAVMVVPVFYCGNTLYVPLGQRSGKVSDSGKVFLVKNSIIEDPIKVNESFRKTLFLREKSKESKGWILDVLKCVDEINKAEFYLKDMYLFEDKLRLKYPNNHYIKDKIRQQLQLLRDKQIIEFLGNGKYRKL